MNGFQNIEWKARLSKTRFRKKREKLSQRVSPPLRIMPPTDSTAIEKPFDEIMAGKPISRPDFSVLLEVERENG